MIGNFIDGALNQRDIVIKGDGTAVRSYLYAADLVIWLLRILHKGENKEIYNVGSSKEITIRQLAEKLGRVQVNVKKESNAVINRYVPCVDKAKLELEVDENYSINEMINKTISFYRKSF